MPLKHRDLKIGIFTSPQSKDLEFERYVIETKQDLTKFFSKVKTPIIMRRNLIQSFEEGYKIILTDIHPRSGFPTYCFESESDNTHLSSFHRQRLLNA
jgi:hypothetical protein